MYITMCVVAPSPIIIEMFIYTNNLIHVNKHFSSKTFSEIKENY